MSQGGAFGSRRLLQDRWRSADAARGICPGALGQNIFTKATTDACRPHHSAGIFTSKDRSRFERSGKF